MGKHFSRAMVLASAALALQFAMAPPAEAQTGLAGKK